MPDLILTAAQRKNVQSLLAAVQQAEHQRNLYVQAILDAHPEYEGAQHVDIQPDRLVVTLPETSSESAA